MMLAPATDADARQVQLYFPSSDRYECYIGVPMLAEKRFVTVEAALNMIPISLRNGAIISMQESATNTHYPGKKPFGSIIY